MPSKQISRSIPYAIIVSVMKDVLTSRPARWLGIIAAAMITACFAIFFLNLTTPPRSLTALLPTRTSTRRPPPTITPVAYPPTPAAVLADNFSERENFPNPSGLNLPFEYSDRGYRLTPPLDPGFVYVLNQTFQDGDYRNLSVNARAAPAPNSSAVEYGIFFWHGEDDQGREHFLAFTVSTNSTYRLLAYEPITGTQQGANVYQFTQILGPLISQDIHLDGTPNRLRVDVHPRRMLAYINDDLVIDTDAKVVGEWRLRRDWDGRVGIFAMTQEAGAEVLFTQFDIYADVKQP